LVYKRLDRGRYRIPLAIPPSAVQVLVTRRELAGLFEGIDRALLRRARQVAVEHQRKRVAPARADAPSRASVHV
jgi:hypothetical protein